MIFTHWLVIAGVIVGFGGSFKYIRDTLIGETKPNRVSWLMWSLAPLISLGAALSSGGDFWANIRVFTAGFIPLIIFIISFVNPKSYWKITFFDLVCGACSAVAIIIWLVIDSPRLAIILALLGDGFAAFPTIIKAWKFPETETGLTFIAGIISVLLILPSIPVWNIENSAFQIYLLIANFSIAISIYRKKIFGYFLADKC
ncbi:MAG TPA: hypothetical protein P5232_00890 [Candidatus Moranbacteria bacterium]|nr:hypothetical protein [Candidatus Moranbacteria bacterium]